MAETIQGRYLMRAVIPETYTLTGNDRNAVLTTAQDNVLDTYNFTKQYNFSIGDCFYFQNTINIKRARIYAAGGEGIRAAADGTEAASLRFAVKQLYDGSGPNLARYSLKFPEWGKWYDINIKINPFDANIVDPWTGTLANKMPCRLAIEQTSKFSIDDFNIQNDYIGQNITPVLELEILTAGIMDMQNGRLY